ncbi:ribonuclease H-like domain-containing protein [Phyllosticta capitalensis]|uniref:ribonuclease H-like domain-containing protein n=1 Tax=Phyllosticta capitalensis TaxID=121624 RepID=UPI00312EE86A
MVAIRVNRNRNSPPRAIVNRRYDPTPAVAATEIGTCGHCGRFLTSSGDQDDTSIFRTNVVFTDGSCLTNAQGQTYTGWGIATGTNESQQYAIPFDCSVGKRTSQRAELLGAYEGMIRGLRDMIRDCPRYGEQHTDWGNRNELVIFCDSEYVVKTMMQWLPVWKANDMKNSSGKTPANLDIILNFDERIDAYAREGYHVGFKHVPRHRNELADKLSKRAAEMDLKVMSGMSRHDASTTVNKSSPDLAVSQFTSSFLQLPNLVD